MRTPLNTKRKRKFKRMALDSSDPRNLPLAPPAASTSGPPQLIKAPSSADMTKRPKVRPMVVSSVGGTSSSSSTAMMRMGAEESTLASSSSSSMAVKRQQQPLGIVVGKILCFSRPDNSRAFYLEICWDDFLKETRNSNWNADCSFAWWIARLSFFSMTVSKVILKQMLD